MFGQILDRTFWLTHVWTDFGQILDRTFWLLFGYFLYPGFLRICSFLRPPRRDSLRSGPNERFDMDRTFWLLFDAQGGARARPNVLTGPASQIVRPACHIVRPASQIVRLAMPGRTV